jgi:hypothetical protein
MPARATSRDPAQLAMGRRRIVVVVESSSNRRQTLRV